MAISPNAKWYILGRACWLVHDICLLHAKTGCEVVVYLDVVVQLGRLCDVVLAAVAE